MTNNIYSLFIAPCTCVGVLRVVGTSALYCDQREIIEQYFMIKGRIYVAHCAYIHYK